MVERTGDKLSDILHKSDSWSDEDCGRQDCLTCASAGESEKKGKCKKRNIIYETYCELCEKVEEETTEKKIEGIEEVECKKRKRRNDEDSNLALSHQN